MRTFVFILIGRGIAVPLNVVATVIVGRLLGASGAGQWALIAAAGSLLHTVLVNWTHSGTVRFGCEEWAQERSLRRTVAARLPILAVSWAAVGLLVLVNPGGWLQRWFVALPHAQVWVGLYAVAIWIAAEAQATIQAIDRFDMQAVAAPVAAVLCVAALAGLGLLEVRTVGAVVLVMTTVPILVWGWAWATAVRDARALHPEFALEELTRHVRYGWPLLPAFAIGYISDWGDHLLLRRFASVAEVGLFAIGYQVFIAILAANSVFTTVLLPRLALQQVHVTDALSLYVRDVVPTLLTFWMIASIWGIAVVPVAIALAAGAGLSGAVVILAMLSVAIPTALVSSLYSVLFNLQHRLAIMLAYSVAISATNVIVSVALIPLYGAMGAAVGTVISYLLGQLLYMVDQHRRVGISPLTVVILWSVGLAAGLLMLASGIAWPSRIVAAAIATVAVSTAARRSHAVNAALVSRLLPGRLKPIATAINRVFGSAPGRSRVTC